MHGPGDYHTKSSELDRKKYMLYDDKAGTDISAAEGIRLLRQQMDEIGYETVTGRGDFGEGKADD